MTTDRTILFVCTGNTCRSPMAAALFNSMNKKGGWVAQSAGIAAFGGDPPTEPATAVLLESYGLDLSGHRSRQASCQMIGQAEWVLTMTPVQRDRLRDICPDWADRIMTIGEMAGEPETIVQDPFGRDLEVYRMTAGSLAELIEKIIDKIT